MLLGPLLVRYNERIADRILRRETSTPSGVAIETAATREIARREHVIICGFGRVGQNLARVLERRGFEYIALDLDPFRVRDARQAGDPVVYGDATHPEVLRALGLDQATCRRDLVCATRHAAAHRARRAAAARRRAGAGAHRGRHAARCAAGRGRNRGRAGDLRDQPRRSSRTCCCSCACRRRRSLATTEEIRHERYAMLRSVFRRRDARGPIDETTPSPRSNCTRSCCRPAPRPSTGRIRELGLDRGPVIVSAIRREGIIGRDPDPATRLRAGRRARAVRGGPKTSSSVEGRLLMG